MELRNEDIGQLTLRGEECQEDSRIEGWKGRRRNKNTNDIGKEK